MKFCLHLDIGNIFHKTVQLNFKIFFQKFQFDSIFPETFSDVLGLNPFCKPFEFRFTCNSRLSLIKMFTLKRVIAWLTLLLFCEMSQRFYVYNCIIKQLLDSVFA